MATFLLIFAAMAAAVVAAPNQYNQAPWNQNQYQNQFQNQQGLINYPGKPETGGNQYGNQVGNNDLAFYPNPQQNAWNNRPNELNNVIVSYPNQPPNQWNNYPNEGNAIPIGNSPPPYNNEFKDCGPSITYKDVPGMQFWCRANCFHIPSFCPSSHCRCW